MLESHPCGCVQAASLSLLSLSLVAHSQVLPPLQAPWPLLFQTLLPAGGSVSLLLLLSGKGAPWLLSASLCSRLLPSRLPSQPLPWAGAPRMTSISVSSKHPAAHRYAKKAPYVHSR